MLCVNGRAACHRCVALLTAMIGARTCEAPVSLLLEYDFKQDKTQSQPAFAQGRQAIHDSGILC